MCAITTSVKVPRSCYDYWHANRRSGKSILRYLSPDDRIVQVGGGVQMKSSSNVYLVSQSMRDSCHNEVLIFVETVRRTSSSSGRICDPSRSCHGHLSSAPSVD